MCHEWGLGSLLWRRNAVGECVCNRASILHFCDISGKQTAYQTDYSLPGAARIAMAQGSCKSLSHSTTPLQLGEMGCESPTGR